MSGRTYVPLSPYDSHDELNPLVNAIVEHLATSTAFEQSVLDAIAWSLNEIADNVLLHAGEGTRGWIQMTEQKKKHRVEMVVVDCGQGIPASLRGAFPGLEDDREALMKAVEKGSHATQRSDRGTALPGRFALHLQLRVGRTCTPALVSCGS